MRVASLLTISAVAAGGLAGFVLGAAWTSGGLPVLGTGVVAGMVGAALFVDLVYAATGRAKPLSVGRQVPAVWTHLLGARVAAVLYGARLGVGPATILQTWLWWAGAVVAASLGVGVSVLWGAGFGVSRSVAMLVVSVAVRRSAGERMRVLLGAERVAGAVVTVGLIAGVGLLWAAG